MTLSIKRHIQIAPRFQGDKKLVDFIHHLDARPLPSSKKVLKQDPSATVSALPVNGRWIVVKHYHADSRFKVFRRSFGKSRARKSWEGAYALKSVGVETVEPIAVIEDRLGFLCLRACFIGAFLKGVNAADYFTAADTPGPAQKQAAQNIIDAIKHFHAFGIVHGDTKHVNILINDDHIAWLDMDAITRPRPKCIQNRRKRRDWRTLLYNWSEHPEVQRMFIHELQEKLGPKYVSSVIGDLIRRRRQKIVEYRKRGIFPTPGDEEILSLKEAVKGLLKNKGEKDWNILRHSSSEILAAKKKTALNKNRQSTVFCRVLRQKKPWPAFFQKARHNRMLINAKLMQSVGVYTPEVVFSDRINGFDCLVTRGLSGLSFQDVMKQCAEGMLRKAEKTRLLATLGKEIGRLHACGFIHGDLRFVNIAVNMEKPVPRICFLSNEHCRYDLNPPDKRIIRDLNGLLQNSRTGLDKNDRLEILAGYEDARSRFNPDWSKKFTQNLHDLLVSSRI